MTATADPDGERSYSQFKRVGHKISFYFRAGTAHSIHSPFLYDLYTNVIRTHTPVAGLQSVMDYLGLIKNDPVPVRFHPEGTSSGMLKTLLPETVIRRESVNRKTGALLFRLVRHFQPATILELGTNLGVSAVYLHSGNPAARVITLEGAAGLVDRARSYLTALGCRQPSVPWKQIQLHQGLFSALLPPVLEEIPSLDFMFFDGHHQKEATLSYFTCCLARVHPGSVFVFDDIHWSAGMEEAWEMITHHPEVTLAIDLYQLGIVIFRKELSQQYFELRF